MAEIELRNFVHMLALMPGLSNTIHREFLSASRDLEYNVHFSQFFTKNEHAIVKFWKLQQIQKVSHPKALASKIVCTKFRSLIFCHSWEIRWTFFKHWKIICYILTCSQCCPNPLNKHTMPCFHFVTHSKIKWFLICKFLMKLW